jgi:hypothetical protein
MSFPPLPFHDSMFSEHGQMNPYWDEELRQLTKRDFVMPEPVKNADVKDEVKDDVIDDVIGDIDDQIEDVKDEELVDDVIVNENVDSDEKPLDALVTEKAVSSTTWTWIIVLGALAVLVIIATLRSKKLRY